MAPLDSRALRAITQEVRMEVGRGRDKHGSAHTSAAGLPTALRLANLGEEFGEVCEALTYDGDGELRDELIQVAAVAVAWVFALDEEAHTG